MAFCLDFAQLNVGGNPANNSAGGQPFVAVAVAPANTTGSNFSCPAGSYVLYTVAEANQRNTLSIDTSSNPERVADMRDLFYSFLLILVVVWGLKQLLNLFTGDTSKD